MTAVKMTEGALLRVLLSVALPITITNLVQASFDIINSFWVGRLGENAIASVVASSALFSVLISLGSGLSTAGAVLIAQNAGAKRVEMLNHIGAQTLLMVGLMALGFTIAGVLTVPLALDLVGVEPAVHSLAASYLYVRYIGMIPMFGFMAFATSWGILGIWWSYPIANGAAASLCIYWLKYGSWRRNLVTADTGAE